MYPLKIKEKYDQNNLNNLGNRFTVVYLGTYLPGDFSEYAGSHPGVDIVPVTKNQEVLAVLDGTVFKAGEDGAYGKFIFLEHKNVPDPENLSKTTTLYSCYEHLSEVKVSTGDVVKEGDIIGKTGNTGNSFGEHLHFQIDRMEAPFHAYWAFTGAEAKAAGLSFTDGVNKGLGLDKARMYTINPLVYLDKLSENKYIKPVENTVLNPVVNNNPQPVVNNTIISTPVTNPVVNNNDSSVEKLETIKSSGNDIISDPSLNALGNLLSDDSKKKTLEI